MQLVHTVAELRQAVASGKKRKFNYRFSSYYGSFT